MVSEKYEELEPSEQSEVDDLVSEQIQPCGSCGWHWHIDSMEESIEFEEIVCFKCAEDERDILEEDD